MQCLSCKQEIPSEATHCAYCGASTRGVPVPTQNTTIAPISKRFVNYLGDWFCMYIISAFLDALLQTNSFMLSWFFIPFTYYFVSEVSWAKSPAKFITKTRVIAEGGGKPSASQAAIRSLVRIIPFYALLFFFTIKMGVGWHDSWTHTRVVVDK
jgi:uncharacterized RDD family membrane protein YckC